MTTGKRASTGAKKNLKKIAARGGSLAGGMGRRAVRQAVPFASNVLYDPKVRGRVRDIMDSPSGKAVSRAAAAKGLDVPLRRLTSEELPAGHYFAKVIIDDWKQFDGQSFRITEKGQVRYGNRIEAPQRGFPLEYRNFVVTSRDESDFALDIPTTFKIAFSRGRYSTAQQDTYDETYGVEQHGGAHYSLRGNTENPTRIIFTFPGFGPSTSRISYAVSYLKQLTDEDLENTLLVAFQDRYFAAGTYMLFDSAGRSIVSDIKKVMADLIRRHHIQEKDVLLFGASKGATSALMYAEDLPEAQILVAVPQLDLPYYFSKPFFIDNLYRIDGFHTIEQPGEKLRRYFAEGRRIDYFYTNDDELSNHSTIEFTRGVRNLRKFRFTGNHGAVARAALPTMLGIMREFMSGQSAHRRLAGRVARSVTRPDGLVDAQVRLPAEPARQLKGGNAYLAGRIGATEYYSTVTPAFRAPHSLFTSTDQQLRPELGEDQGLDRAVYWKADRSIVSFDLAGAGGADHDRVDVGDEILLETPAASYRILDHDRSDVLTYAARTADGDPGHLHVALVGDPAVEAGAPRTASRIVQVKVDEDTALVHLLILRLAAATRATTLTIEVDAVLSEEQKAALKALEWPGISVTMAGSDI